MIRVERLRSRRQTSPGKLARVWQRARELRSQRRQERRQERDDGSGAAAMPPKVCESKMAFGVLGVLLFGTFVTACATRAPLADQATASTSDRTRAASEMLADAKVLLESGDYGRAEQYAEFAARNGASAESVMPLILEACIRDQRFRAAVEHGQHHLKRHPSDHAVRLLLASIHGVLGEVDLARRELDRVIEARPDWAQAHYALAVLLRDEIGDFSGADEHFRTYLRLEPNGLHRAEATGSLLSRIE